MGSRLEKNSNAVRKRIEGHTFEDEQGEEYQGSSFGGFTDYFRRKKIKLQNLDSELRAHSTKPPIFRGVVAHVNGYTQPSLNDLHHIIVSHGGGFMQYLDGKTTVTHIIASSLTPKKVVEFRRYRIVKPAWVVESVKAGYLLPWNTFRVVDEGAGQKILQLDNGYISTQVNHYKGGYKDQTDTSWYTNQLIAPDINTLDEPTGAPCSTEAACVSSQVTPDASTADALDDEDDSFKDGDVDQRKDSYRPEYGLVLSDVVDSERQVPATWDTQAEAPNANLGSIQQREEDRRPDSILNKHVPIDHEQLVERESPESSLASSNTPTSALDRLQTSDLENHDLSEKVKMSAEEHNSLLLADPYVRKSSTLNPDFLQQYYRESRLHHLSTWKADLKAQLQSMTAEKTLSQNARQKRAKGSRRYILHVDFDSFFVAVSLKRHAEHVGKPAVVAHGTGSGSEIASCNYPARKYGVKNGMWMKRALELCPDLKVLPYDFPAYEEASRKFYDASIATGGVVQSVSIDEALIDVTAICLLEGGTDGTVVRDGSLWREQNKADEIAQTLRDRVKDETDCSVSVGIGGNILVAKCALRKAKPAGQYQVKPDAVLEFLAPLEVQALPGVAWSTGGKLEELGIRLVKDIRESSKEKLVSTLGPKTGEKLWNYSRGNDYTEVGEQVHRKSVSAEVNWGVRFETQEQAEEFVDSLCGELNKRLLRELVKGRQFTMKIMKRAADAPLDPPKHLGHGKCDTFNKSTMLGVATNAKEVLSREAISILRGFGFSPGELRGLGVQMQKLESIKGAAGVTSDSSQKRLQFKVGPNVSKVEQEPIDPIEDDIKTPKKTKQFLGVLPASENSPSRKPLNTMGTQFLLPSQVDPEVLDALPQEIRTRLSSRIASDPMVETGLEKAVSGSLAACATGWPDKSQLDPEILDALPDELKAEIYASYNASPPKIHGQSVLPQSPRKQRSIPQSKKSFVSRTKFRGGLIPRVRGTGGRDSSTLTQANFVTIGRPSLRQANRDLKSEADTNVRDTEDTEPVAEVSPEFLAALPEDIRREVLDQQRRERLKRTSGLDLARNSNQWRRRPQQTLHLPGGQRLLNLEPRPSKPTFTTQGLSDIEDLREAVEAWFHEFEDDGPYQEDVEALITYLGKVIEVERDMSKATRLVKWMTWVLEQGLHGKEAKRSRELRSKAKWAAALVSVKDGVKAAVKARGLGDIDL